MAFLKHSSWGNTRQLKNIAGIHGTEVDVVLVATLDAATDGYATESQRYLHTLVIDKNNDANLTVALYGYSHAFGEWFVLNQLGTSTHATISVGDSGASEATQTPVQREMVTFEIAGIDRVAFVGTTADVRVFAACSTF